MNTNNPDASVIAESEQMIVAQLERQLTQSMRSFEALFRKRAYPLERAHYLLLVVLREKSPQTLSELATRLALDDSTITRQVATMERLGLIERLPNPRDGRSFVISPTLQGEQAAAQMRQARLLRLQEMLADWDGDEQAQLTQLLTKLNSTVTLLLQKLDREPTAP